MWRDAKWHQDLGCRFISHSADMRASCPSTDLPLHRHLLLSLFLNSTHAHKKRSYKTIYFWDGWTPLISSLCLSAKMQVLGAAFPPSEEQTLPLLGAALCRSHVAVWWSLHPRSKACVLGSQSHLGMLWMGAPVDGWKPGRVHQAHSYYLCSQLGRREDCCYGAVQNRDWQAFLSHHVEEMITDS